MFYPSNVQDEQQTPTPVARPRGPKTRGSYSSKSRPAMITTHSQMEISKSMAISSPEASTDDGPPVNWWEQPRGRQRPSPIPIPIPDTTPKPTMLDLDTRNSGIGLGLPPHMRSFSPAPPMSAASDGPASPAALFLSAFSSPAPSVRSPSPLPSVISPAMAMFHSPPPVPTHATVASPTSCLIDQGVSVGGYVLGPVIGHGGFSTIRTATSPTTAGVVAVKIVSVKPKLPAPAPTDAPRGRLGNRAATVGRAATTTIRGRTPDASSDNDGRPIAEEAALWSTLSHEHILPLFSAEESDSLGAWFLFTLYCPAGTLLDLLKRDGQIITPSAQNTPSKRRPSFASSFSPVNSISRGRSGSITQPQPQRGGLLPETAATLFRQVVRGLRYLHEVARVVHRDIKLENVLVDENGGARITDFGLAVQLDEEPVRSSIERSRSRVSAERTRRSVSRHRTFSTYAPPGHGHAPPSYGLGRANSVSVTSTTPPTAKNKFPPGSLPYAAPELLKPSRSRSRERSNDSDKPNPAQDIWALGCVLHALFTGKLPFSDAFEPRLQMKIVRGIWDEGVVNLIPNSSTLIETLRGCLSVDLAERWSIAMVDEYAWAIGIADEEAEREAMRAQRGRSVGRGRRGLSAIRDRDGAKDDDTGSVQGGGLASSYSPSNRSVSRSRPSASDNVRPTRLPSLTRQPSLSPFDARVRQSTSPSRSSLSPHDSVSPALTRQPSSPSRHASPARPSMIPRPMVLAKQSPLASGDATPTLTNKQLSAPGCLAAPASTLEILDSASSTPVPVHRDGESSAVSALSSLSSIPQLHTARSFSSVTSSAVPPLSPGSDSLRSPLATRGTSVERTGRAPSMDRLSVGRNSSVGRGASTERIGRTSSRAPSLHRTPSTDRVERAPSTERTRRAPSLGRALSSERFSAKTRPPVDIIQSGSPSSSGPRTPEEVPPQRGRLASRLEVVDEGDHHHVWGGVEVQGYPTSKPDA
ncbi:Protein tyrosine kinase [Rhizoctonia solani]|uniref:Protein tyrosine kinase n=1 Tax=Rhizoctonia solani TaxID=456999 RepID=A0A8H7LFC5_9AGAM|nr:Protein tyrosine kinase [Rhizoctonia solani]